MRRVRHGGARRQTPKDNCVWRRRLSSIPIGADLNDQHALRKACALGRKRSTYQLVPVAPGMPWADRRAEATVGVAEGGAEATVAVVAGLGQPALERQSLLGPVKDLGDNRAKKIPWPWDSQCQNGTALPAVEHQGPDTLSKLPLLMSLG